MRNTAFAVVSTAFAVTNRNLLARQVPGLDKLFMKAVKNQ